MYPRSFFNGCVYEEIPLIQLHHDNSITATHKEPCNIVYQAGTDSVGWHALVKSRGGISIRYPKRSYTIKLPESYSLAGLPADNDWILNANYIDKTFMRHKICYDIFRQMHPLNISPMCRYANLEVNGAYQGLYVVMERLDGTRLKVDKNDSLAMIFKDPPIFFKDKLKHVQDSSNYYHQKYPDKSKFDKTDYIALFQDFLFYSVDSVFVKNISTWVDIRNILDWHLLLLLTNNSDGIMKNFYLYKVDEVTPFRLAIWDFDHSFGRDGDNELNMMERELNCNRSVLLRRLMETHAGNYNTQLQERWHALRDQHIFSYDNICTLIRQNDAIISRHVTKNFHKWPAHAPWYFDSNTYRDELEIIKEFIKIRIPHLDSTFKYSGKN